MGSKWKQTTLGDLALGFDGAVDGPFGSNLPASAYTESGYPIIRGSNLSIGLDDFKDSDFVFVPEHIFKKLSRSECRAGDIIFTKKGTLGQTGIISTTHRFEKYLLSSNQMRLRVDPDKALPEYVYYYVSSQQAINKLIQDSECTGVPKINLAYLKSFPISLPSLIEQKDIIDILGSFNRKITLNRQINRTLEQISQTLFKSWFVDFDPVIDNALDAGNPIPEALQSRAELRQKVRNSADFKPLPADIRALFPAEFDETELGYAPKGWMTNRLENILELAYGKALKKTERTNGNYPVYGSGGVDGTHNEYLVKGPGVIVGRKGTVGSLHWENKNFYPIDTVFFVKPKEYYSLVYCYQLLKTLGLENMNTDAAVPGLNRNNAYRLEVVTPTQSIIAKFTNIIQTIQHKMDSNHNETENLTALRDTLLPKLISGELSLEDLPDLVTQTEPA
ncbi:TPA: restriction endonuclease subunit S [Klebsiella quasipneumoniae subsp. similipneumoniae]|nr:restriction endonuclease subunit S [Klebsiella quasipneumoniae subsp. similipneumoniae]HCI6775298.1 restriction endonuclease subunit S [Klebsiella quasipneumoniae subsp. similipneumoniae]